MKKIYIFLKYENIFIPVCDGDNVVKAVARVLPNHPMNGCRGGGCGICRIRVINGNYITKKMSSEHISEEDISNGELLACKVFPTGDMELEYMGSKLRR
ncbi:2Fe-2S iron-sulfur cluster-binding protein [Microaceticoccus formicicus]|uniref:2Fe-2S iron-sulfur cluster-binding protein n=1 Tax=Microaceticoccus formicicus TaxID=3118105 RepID=UPI003CD04C44|nr:2Fe-2S iron-sulfur cluster-binding protein [Peptoniphilaceae bacterium AMB_02]